jgi:hypothetical protein
LHRVNSGIFGLQALLVSTIADKVSPNGCSSASLQVLSRDRRCSTSVDTNRCESSRLPVRCTAMKWAHRFRYDEVDIGPSIFCNAVETPFRFNLNDVWFRIPSARAASAQTTTSGRGREGCLCAHKRTSELEPGDPEKWILAFDYPHRGPHRHVSDENLVNVGFWHLRQIASIGERMRNQHLS